MTTMLKWLEWEYASNHTLCDEVCKMYILCDLKLWEKAGSYF